MTKGRFPEDALERHRTKEGDGIVSHGCLWLTNESRRTTASLGIVHAERDRYWDKDRIFRFWEDTYR